MSSSRAFERLFIDHRTTTTRRMILRRRNKLGKWAVLASHFRGEKHHFLRSRGLDGVKLVEKVFNASSFGIFEQVQGAKNTRRTRTQRKGSSRRLLHYLERSLRRVAVDVASFGSSKKISLGSSRCSRQIFLLSSLSLVKRLRCWAGMLALGIPAPQLAPIFRGGARDRGPRGGYGVNPLSPHI